MLDEVECNFLIKYPVELSNDGGSLFGTYGTTPRRDGLGPLSQDGSTDWGGREEGREDADDGVSDAKGGGGRGGGGGRDIATFLCFKGGRGNLDLVFSLIIFHTTICCVGEI